MKLTCSCNDKIFVTINIIMTVTLLHIVLKNPFYLRLYSQYYNVLEDLTEMKSC